ncbi:MAG: response regulator [Deltaproteobacteria bacterium]|nr:response regulator [Deltaproteobacteria bacterium]
MARNKIEDTDSSAVDSTLPKPSLLLVDGDPLSAWNIGRVLTRAGFSVQATSNGKDALHLLKNHDFDLMISDIHVDGIDGLTLIDWVARNRPDTIIAVMSSEASDAARNRCFEYGCVLVVDKETDPGFLIETLRHYFDTRSTIPGDVTGTQAVLQPLMEAASQRCDGEIVVRSKNEVGRVFFVNGKLAWAHVSSETSGLTRDLVEHAGLAKSDLKQVFDECRADNRNFAETLVEWGFIQNSVMRELLLSRIVRCLLQMSAWDTPRSLFLPQHRAYKGELLFSLDEVVCAMTSPEPEKATQLRNHG